MKFVPALALALLPLTPPSAAPPAPVPPVPPVAVEDDDPVTPEADSEVKERRKVYEEFLGRELGFAWSDNFLVLADNEKPFKFGKRKLAGADLAAEVVRRCHAILADYCELFEANPRKDFKHRVEILMWDDAEVHIKVAKEVLEWTPGEETVDWPVRYGGDRGTYSMVLGSEFVKDGEMLERRLVHNVTRALFSAQTPMAVLNNTGNCWLSLGLGMWMEDRHCGLINSVDNKNLLEELPRKAKKWRPAVRKLVDKDKVEEFKDLVQTPEAGFEGDGALVAASLVDFLLARDRALFRELCLHMKSKTPTRDAVQVVYGWRDDAFEDAWSAWVQETYSKR